LPLVSECLESLVECLVHAGRPADPDSSHLREVVFAARYQLLLEEVMVPLAFIDSFESQPRDELEIVFVVSLTVLV
jgi:hypothetical protein